MRYLLDTNILSEVQRKRPEPCVIATLERHQGQCAIASITWHELQYGCQRLPPSNRHNKLAEYLEIIRATIPIFPYDEAAVQWHARERSRLVAIGKTPPFADGQIAAIAATQNLILATRNVQDFHMFDGLLFENWFEDEP